MTNTKEDKGRILPFLSIREFVLLLVAAILVVLFYFVGASSLFEFFVSLFGIPSMIVGNSSPTILSHDDYTPVILFIKLLALPVAAFSIAGIFTGYKRTTIWSIVLLVISILLLIENIAILTVLGFALVLILFKCLLNRAFIARFLKGGWIPALFVGTAILICLIPQFDYPFRDSANRHGYTHQMIRMSIKQGQNLGLLMALILALIGTLKLRSELVPRSLRFPRPLPRVTPARRGYTLIELLIVIAIISITAPFVLHAIQTAAGQIQKSRDAREATRIVRNEFEKFNAGVYTLEPGGQSRVVDGLTFVITVAEPDDDGLIPVAVEVVVGPEWRRETLEFETLIPPPREVAANAP